jgi:hypothetical protein
MSQTFASYKEVPEALKQKIVKIANHGKTSFGSPSQFETWETIIPDCDGQNCLDFISDAQAKWLVEQSFRFDVSLKEIRKKMGMTSDWVYVEEEKQKIAVPNDLMGWRPDGIYICVAEDGSIGT